ncbi:hypothetical protein [Legionella parisiensis]|uniref:Uncharacterized protein n=1 Tax=Legionella parisiensis TaxID=45071 RepID=A0A1E5JLV9_9GAMM|nr:hypothetical protein [Legionella parisiensis]KTD40528.1 hypothetical protein Lpar_1845 [Legionella parisiensis]OEH45537.1 hypothetical protein lpari_03496 [Legionella parisiensis]STX72247.1 Uncharacterised protein [Legionella parisiensis]
MSKRIPQITLIFDQGTKSEVHFTYRANLTDSEFKRKIGASDIEDNADDETYPCYVKGETLSRAISISEKEKSGCTRTHIFTVIFQNEAEIDKFEKDLREGNMSLLANAMDTVRPFSTDNINNIKKFLTEHSSQSPQIDINETDSDVPLTAKKKSDLDSPYSPRLFASKDTTPPNSRTDTNQFKI